MNNSIRVVTIEASMDLVIYGYLLCKRVAENGEETVTFYLKVKKI